MSAKSVKFLHKVLLMLADVLAVTAAAAFAYFCTVTGAALTTPIWLWWAINVVTAVAVFLLCSLYNVVFHSVGLPELGRCGMASAILGIANGIFALITKGAYITLGTASVYTITLFCSQDCKGTDTRQSNVFSIPAKRRG